MATEFIDKARISVSAGKGGNGAVAFHGENHELSRGGKPKGRIRRLQEITAWMDKYLKEE